jgi:ATP-dependent RNA helicase DDX18/HAS1
LRSVFNINSLDLVKVAKSFGFPTPPRVDIALGASMKKGNEGRRAYGSQPKANSAVKRTPFAWHGMAQRVKAF